ncbi:hypothetical protein [Arthrobacter sp. CAN_C5]|uniref:hypothetical protein n=1 Tax=Arthrobacter sp. CAN_C5 TaxID=2760706 RepID=UPI001AE3B66F|nr:hypothetical protein [Arthrobacter sp. CAN_C5]MBP2216368.1 hypothetical protein [Arthrobacter sp. CAN_C5]
MSDQPSRPTPDPAPEDTGNPVAARTRPTPRVMMAAGLATVIVLIGAGVGITALTGDDEPAATPSSSATATATAPSAPAATTSPAPTTEPVPEPTDAQPEAPTDFYEQAGPPDGSPLEAVEPMTVSVSAEPTGTELPSNLIGLSLEATDLADPRMSGDNEEIVSSLTGLGRPMLRFGGNAVDRRFFWTSTNEPIPGNLSGDDAHPVRAAGPADLERVNTLLEAADATISLTVDLGNYDPARAADMTRYASEIFGDRLVGITVGNEPNGYPTNGLRPSNWGIPDYLAELSAYAEAMYAVAPEVRIVGPGTYAEAWWDPFAQADLPQEKILSFHHYPLSQCDGANDPLGEPIMENLMASPIHDRAQNYRSAALAPAKEAGLETWIPETGISACPGSNETTKTHASALWTVDYALSAAEIGVARLSFHSSLLTCVGGPPMSSICSGGPYLQPDATFNERANYYGLSMVAELPPGAFLQNTVDGGGLAYSYAIEHEDGSISVVLVNQNDPEVSAQTDVTVQLPAGARTSAMTQLGGPSYGAEDATVIDGQPAPPVPAADRPAVPGFVPGAESVQVPVTAGTVSVLTFTF